MQHVTAVLTFLHANANNTSKHISFNFCNRCNDPNCPRSFDANANAEPLQTNFRHISTRSDPNRKLLSHL